MKSIQHVRQASDLHIEKYQLSLPEHFVACFEDILPPHEFDSTSLLILGGDISTNRQYLITFLKHCKERFADIVFLPGNHEYYGSDFVEWNSWADLATKSYAHICNDKVSSVVFDYKGKKLEVIFCTLWTSCGVTKADIDSLEAGLNDFRYIGNFTASNWKSLHGQHVYELINALERSTADIRIIATHYIPSYRLVNLKWIGLPTTNGFASDCSDVFSYTKHPHIWTYGHTHDKSIQGIGLTDFYCNPCGYGWQPRNTDPVFLDLEAPFAPSPFGV